MENDRNKYKNLSEKINKFNSGIEFLTNNDNDNNDIESVIQKNISNNIKQNRYHNEITEKDKDDNNETNQLIKIKKSKNEENFIKETFEEIYKNQNIGKLDIIKNLNLEENIKKDFSKKNFQRDFLLDKSLKDLENKRNNYKKKYRIACFFTFIYSCYTVSVFYNFRLNKSNEIKEKILNRPILNKLKIINYFLPLLGSLFYIYYLNKEINIIDKFFLNNFEKEGYIDMNQDIIDYKFHSVENKE
jgi:hypothetical protein